MEFKGTKGEWSVRPSGKNRHNVTELEIDSDYGVDSLATVYSPEYDDIEPSEYQANAKAISAVPDMIKALLLVVNKPRHEWDLQDEAICRNAIAKALTL